MRHIITAAVLMAAFATPASAQTAGDGNDDAISIRSVTAPLSRTECRGAGGARTCKDAWYSETVGYSITARDGREVYVSLDMLIGAGVGKERVERLPGW
jgi:hypothetical protein